MSSVVSIFESLYLKSDSMTKADGYPAFDADAWSELMIVSQAVVIVDKFDIPGIAALGQHVWNVAVL